MSILLPCRTPVTLQGVAQPYNRGRGHIVTEGLENTGSGDNRVRQINLLCSKPELYPLSSMKNWSGEEGEMQSISFAKIMRQKGIKPPPLCFATQNIGEVSEGRRGWKNSDNSKPGINLSLAVSRSIAGCSEAIGEKPKKQPFLRRGVGIYKDNPHELSTEPSSYSSQKDFFRLSSKEWITLKAEIIHTENKTNNPLVFIRHYHLRIPTRGLSQSIRFLKT